VRAEITGRLLRMMTVEELDAIKIYNKMKPDPIVSKLLLEIQEMRAMLKDYANGHSDLLQEIVRDYVNGCR
jgi:hypothetical protein